MLKRSPMPRPTKPMTRKPFQRKTGMTASRKPIGRSRPKTTKIRQSARDEDCTLMLTGVCNGDSTTSVWAHSNRGIDGKGLGIKARDENGAVSCSACHAVYDRQAPRPSGMTLEYVEDRFTQAMEVSYAILQRKGLVPNTNLKGLI